jgi:hypothetical protein
VCASVIGAYSVRIRCERLFSTDTTCRSLVLFPPASPTTSCVYRSPDRVLHHCSYSSVNVIDDRTPNNPLTCRDAPDGTKPKPPHGHLRSPSEPVRRRDTQVQSERSMHQDHRTLPNPVPSRRLQPCPCIAPPPARVRQHTGRGLWNGRGQHCELSGLSVVALWTRRRFPTGRTQIRRIDRNEHGDDATSCKHGQAMPGDTAQSVRSRARRILTTRHV